MNNLYYYETIEECEKEIINKSINLDINYTSNCNLLECFSRAIRTSMLWIAIFIEFIISFEKNWNYTFGVVLVYIIIYCAFLFLMSWVKFNHNRAYMKAKVNLVDGLIERCKEWNETKYEEWQRKQMLKRFAALGNIDIDWNNAE